MWELVEGERDSRGRVGCAQDSERWSRESGGDRDERSATGNAGQACTGFQISDAISDVISDLKGSRVRVGEGRELSDVQGT